jgi:hypothetical protein
MVSHGDYALYRYGVQRPVDAVRAATGEPRTLGDVLARNRTADGDDGGFSLSLVCSSAMAFDAETVLRATLARALPQTTLADRGVWMPLHAPPPPQSSSTAAMSSSPPAVATIATPAASARLLGWDSASKTTTSLAAMSAASPTRPLSAGGRRDRMSSAAASASANVGGIHVYFAVLRPTEPAVLQSDSCAPTDDQDASERVVTETTEAAGADAPSSTSVFCDEFVFALACENSLGDTVHQDFDQDLGDFGEQLLAHISADRRIGGSAADELPSTCDLLRHWYSHTMMYFPRVVRALTRESLATLLFCGLVRCPCEFLPIAEAGDAAEHALRKLLHDLERTLRILPLMPLHFRQAGSDERTEPHWLPAQHVRLRRRETALSALSAAEASAVSEHNMFSASDDDLAGIGLDSVTLDMSGEVGSEFCLRIADRLRAEVLVKSPEPLALRLRRVLQAYQLHLRDQFGKLQNATQRHDSDYYTRFRILLTLQRMAFSKVLQALLPPGELFPSVSVARALITR